MGWCSRLNPPKCKFGSHTDHKEAQACQARRHHHHHLRSKERRRKAAQDGPDACGCRAKQGWCSRLSPAGCKTGSRTSPKEAASCKENSHRHDEVKDRDKEQKRGYKTDLCGCALASQGWSRTANPPRCVKGATTTTQDAKWCLKNGKVEVVGNIMAPPGTLVPKKVHTDACGCKIQGHGWASKGDRPGCHFGAHTDDSEKEKCLRNKVVVVGSGSSQADQARALGIYWYWKHSVERKAKQAATADSIARARSPTQKAWSPDFSGLNKVEEVKAKWEYKAGDFSRKGKRQGTGNHPLTGNKKGNNGRGKGKLKAEVQKKEESESLGTGPGLRRRRAAHQPRKIRLEGHGSKVLHGLGKVAQHKMEKEVEVKLGQKTQAATAQAGKGKGKRDPGMSEISKKEREKQIAKAKKKLEEGKKKLNARSTPMRDEAVKQAAKEGLQKKAGIVKPGPRARLLQLDAAVDQCVEVRSAGVCK